MTSPLYVPALRGIMGDWVYYSCIMTMSDVGTRVSYARELHRSRALSQYIQRALEESRAEDIACYLATQEQRFFGALVVAVYEGDPKWYGSMPLESRTGSFRIEDVPEEAAASLGFLVLGGKERLFALDGQHRLAGVKLGLAREEVDPDEQLPLLMVAHRKGKAGLERTRRLFVTLNKTAVAVPKREIIALDEDDVAAICTRRLVDGHPLCGTGRVALNKTSNLGDDDRTHFTSIVALYDSLMALFGKLPRKASRKQLRFNRPSGQEIQEYYGVACEFLDGLTERIEPLQRYAKLKKPSTERVHGRGDFGGNLVFRPVGLVMLGSLVGEIGTRHGLDTALDETAKLPLELSKKPLVGVLWNKGKKTMIPDGKALAKRVFKYTLGATTDERKLRKDIAVALDVPAQEIDLPTVKSDVLS